MLHTLRIMDARKGDIAVEYAPPEVKTKAAVESRKAAEKIFNDIMDRGMTAVVMDPAREGEMFKKGSAFDPTVVEMIAIPQIVGGACE